MRTFLTATLLSVASLAIAQDLPLWLPSADPGEADYYVAFRGQFDLPQDTEVEFRLLGASWYVAHIDSEYLTEGPARFPIAHPEYQSVRARLSAGKHLIAVQVHHEGVSTRILDNVPPFLMCTVQSGTSVVPVQWKCTRLDAYSSKVQRTNAQFGWIEWCDTRKLPEGWTSAGFDDGAWAAPVPANVPIGPVAPLSIAEVQRFTHALTPIAVGPLAENFGYEKDNPSARFFLRDLVCDTLPPEGTWRRYDLGRVRLGRPQFVLDVPAGTVVEFAYSESLSHGRVAPWITLSASDSCNLDHYVARGGKQEFSPLRPIGGRYLEVHILPPFTPSSQVVQTPVESAKTGRVAPIRFITEEYIERGYYAEPEGAFHSGDELLDRIWSTGVETHRACAEDALIDNPTRERGQWAGDVVTVGMEIAAAAYSDLRLCRRGLVQCAQCAREDGLIAGLCPGGAAYLTTYAAQWITACLKYWELTGDRALLSEMFPAAERNLAAFEKHLTPDGIADGLGWGFVDWGYVRNEGPVDIAVNLHYLAALRDMIRWCDVLGENQEKALYAVTERKMTAILDRWFDSQRRDGRVDWEAIGYHRAVLGLRLGFFTVSEEAEAVEYIKRHMLSCFPNDLNAPRLGAPDQNQTRLITPYFAHYAMPELVARGEMDFVLDQYRKCWGWALEDGRATWLEVFDTRWSHCHQWAGSPTWQLTRYALGLKPRFDLGENHYEWTFNPGSLKQASGKIPSPNGPIEIDWTVTEDGKLHYTVTTPVEIHIHMQGEVIDIKNGQELVFENGKLKP